MPTAVANNSGIAEQIPVWRRGQNVANDEAERRMPVARSITRDLMNPDQVWAEKRLSLLHKCLDNPAWLVP